jgi:hypothetical protein
VKYEEAKKLCLELVRTDGEDEIVAVLKKKGLWDNPDCWRYYGDDELNWNRAGNQQARSDFAVNEKLVNTIDSRLMLECMLAGLPPEDPKAPQTMREAVNRFIEKTWGGTLKVSGGRIEEWPTKFRTQIAEGISVFVTGPKGQKPSVNVADLGEGHTPEAFPDTLLSLGKHNKIRVNFAQGKYGQGSTGAIRFCGKRKLQLIVSRRHPKLVGNAAVSDTYPKHDSDDCWGFTIVRREGEGLNIRTPFYSYLAPIGADTAPRKGRVLRFKADEMPLFPKGDDAYERPVGHGTLVKLYEYNLTTVSNILRRSGLRPKIDLLLPEPALPMRFHECRDHQKFGTEQAETMSGLFARLNGNANLEEVKPADVTITVGGHEMVARIFAFKPGHSDTYRNNEGVIFTINGQAQGYIKAAVFARKKVGLQRLAKDLLVVLDCSSLTAMEQHDMFMPSRDRLVEDNAFAAEIEKKLEQMLHDHGGLRELKNLRQKLDVDEQLADNKPIEDVLKRVFRTSPTLARIFGMGTRLHNPFKPAAVQPSEKPFVGKPHPTFFRFSGKEEGDVLARAAHLESRVRVPFDTDVVDEYFTRKVDRGVKDFARIVDGKRVPLLDFVGPNLSDGRANLTFDLPEDVKAGDVVEMEFIVRDPVMGNEFVNRAKFAVLAAFEPGDKKPTTKKKDPPGQTPGEQPDGNAGIAFPKVHWVKEGAPTWPNYFKSPDDCLTIIDDGDTVAGKWQPEYKFYLNETNKALQTELKSTKLSAAAVRKQYEIGVVLMGMALIHDDKQHGGEKAKDSNDGKKEDEEVFKRAAIFTRAVAPIIIPMIQALGDLAEEEVDLSDLVGVAA